MNGEIYDLTKNPKFIAAKQKHSAAKHINLYYRYTNGPPHTKNRTQVLQTDVDRLISLSNYFDAEIFKLLKRVKDLEDTIKNLGSGPLTQPGATGTFEPQCTYTEN